MQDQNTNAMLLLCSHFSKLKNDAGRPLTPLEYGRLAKWLHEQGSLPSDLMLDFDKRIENWNDPKGKITRERLKALFGRGMTLALALEKWERAGIWVVTRSQKEYPRRLKRRLEHASPAFFYGVGNKQLLNAGGVGIVGSRGIDDSDKRFTQEIAKQAALEGLNVVSGGARGVDETAMLGALSVEGTAVGILADGLLKASVSTKWREYLMNNQLVLVSPFYPEVGFQVGNAMARNKYIYCMADYCLVVRSDKGKGGTWSGATENMKKQWVPTFVKEQSDAAGNAALIEQGAKPLQFVVDGDRTTGDEPLRTLFASDEPPQLNSESHETAKEDEIGHIQNEISEDSNKEEPVAQANSHQEASQAIEKSDLNVQKQEQLVETGPDVFYLVFTKLVRQQFDEKPEIKLKEFSERYPDISNKLMTLWFDRAVDEGLVQRKGKMRTYVLPDDSQQLEML